MPYQIDIRPSQEFELELAKLKLSMILFNNSPDYARLLVPDDAFGDDHMGVGKDVAYTSQQGKLLSLSGSIDTESKTSLGCAGALVTYLQRKRSACVMINDPSIQESFHVKSIEMLNMHGTMSGQY